jgi:hypothetical protein
MPGFPPVLPASRDIFEADVIAGGFPCLRCTRLKLLPARSGLPQPALRFISLYARASAGNFCGRPLSHTADRPAMASWPDKPTGLRTYKPLDPLSGEPRFIAVCSNERLT